MRQQQSLLSTSQPDSDPAGPGGRTDTSRIESATVSNESSVRAASVEDGRVAEADLPSLSKDVIFDLLRVERRRMTLHFLRHRGPRSTLSTLARQLAAEENGIDVRAVTSTQRKRVYIALYQSHLPKMDDVGVVSFDPRQGAVELADNASLLYPYLDLEADRPSSPNGHRRVVAVLRQVGTRLSLFDDGGHAAESTDGRDDPPPR